MMNPTQKQKAEQFLALHRTPPLLVLPNAWDVVSARVFEAEGFRAIGTTSAGIAAVLGYPDGQRIGRDEMLEFIRRIAARVQVPLSADIEAGYADSPEGVAASARAAVAAGAVGINLEDGTGDHNEPLFDISLQAEKLAAVREMARAMGFPLVINARTDVYLTGDEPPADRFRKTVQRAHAYVDAGADCVFVPDMGTLDRGTMARLVREVDAPLNIIAGEGTPSLQELEEMGVARVSFGPRPMRAALALVRRIAREWIRAGTYEAMLADTISYDEVNRLLSGSA